MKQINKMKKLFLLLIFIPIVSFGQEQTKPFIIKKSLNGKTSSHIFFGIDLNSDWYSLTDLSKLSHTIPNDLNPNAPFKYVPLSESIFSSVNIDLKQLGFEILLGFPSDSGSISDFNKFPPSILNASFKYSNTSVGIDKLSALFALIVKKYGFPDEMLSNKDPNIDTGNFIWSGKNYSITVSFKPSNKNVITLIYFKL